jgi:transcriptional regulator with GAF, ATPase, and Fis domain
MINSCGENRGWTAVGANYLEACKLVAADGDVYARQALEGIEAVLAGDISSFALEYPSEDSGGRPGNQRWCLMQVDGLPPAPGGVVITHTDVTNLKQTEASLREALIEVHQLKNQLQQENLYLEQEIKLEHYPGEIIGQSAALRQVLQQVEQVAATDTTVLILGETGTGKELVARAIHDSSSRKNRPLVKVNCAALPSTLIESELFGHEKGAFTGAQSRKIGRFELANGGTLMLDEIGDLPPELQVKLLRVLQEGEFERLGSSNTIQVNVRVIAATNRDLKQDVRESRFRADLWYRLNIFPITMPPLRNRKEDIPLLTDHFVSKFSKKVGKRFSAISPAAIESLDSYGWPGNVRELASVIERAVIVSSGPVLTLADKLDSNREAHAARAGRMTLEEIERDCITDRLEEAGWKIDGKGGAAESLGINPSTLRSRMVKLGIRTPQKQYARGRS